MVSHICLLAELGQIYGISSISLKWEGAGCYALAVFEMFGDRRYSVHLSLGAVSWSVIVAFPGFV